MVTVRQFSRGVSRTLNAMERDARRAQRQRLLQEQAFARQALLDASAEATDAYARLLDILTGCHRIAFSRMNWTETAHAPLPEDPPYSDLMESRAAAELAAYRPGWFARTFGLAEGRRTKLRAAIAKARAADAEDHRSACEKAARRREEIQFAQAVEALGSEALLAAVDANATFDAIGIEGLDILAINGRVIVVVDAFELEDMPTRSVSLLQSGKASYKQLSPTRVLEIHRDNICSSAIRVAAEFLRVLPIDAIEVVMQADLLDRGTGHIAPQPILYARIAAQALESVNLTRAEAMPLAERLGAVFDWNRKEGLRPLDLARFDLPLELLKERTEPA